MQEHQPPVAHAGPVAEPQAHLFRVVQRQLDLLEQLRAGTLHFVVGNGFGRGLFRDVDELREHRVQRLAFAHLRDVARHPGLADLQAGLEYRRGLAGLHQRFVQTPRRRVAQDLVEHLQRGHVFVRPGWRVVGDGGPLHVARTAKHHLPFAILRGFDGVQ